jgi:hypothetical protein
LVAHLDTQLLSAEQIETFQMFAARVSDKLEAMVEDFAERVIVEALDVQVTLAVESGQTVVYVRCILGEQVCGLRPPPFVI